MVYELLDFYVVGYFHDFFLDRRIVDSEKSIEYGVMRMVRSVNRYISIEIIFIISLALNHYTTNP